MNRAVLAALWSHWRRNRLQFAALLLGLALATALWTGVQAINVEARASYDAAAAMLAEDRHDRLLPQQGGTLDEARFAELRRAGWLVSPVLEGHLRTGERERLRLIGVDPLTAPPGSSARAALAAVDAAQFLRGEVVLAHPDTAGRVPGNLRVHADPSILPGMVLADLRLAQKLLDRPGGVSRLIVLPGQPAGQRQLQEVAPDLLLQQADGGSDIGRLTDSFHLNLTAFGLLSFAVGAFIVHGAIGLAFEQRRGTVRTLRALGVPLRRIMALTVAELLLLAAIAGSIGVLLGYLVASLLLPDVSSSLQSLYGTAVASRLQIRPQWWLAGLGMALAGTLTAASGALWRLAHMPVLAGAGGRAWALASVRSNRRQAALAVLLLLVAAFTGSFGRGLIAGFALLACFMLGAALLLPAGLDLLLRGGARLARRPMAQWFWADARQQLPGLGLALMSLLLAMAANVGVSTMVSSFRLTFAGFLDQRLAAELYVDAAGVQDGDRLARFLDERAAEVLPGLSAEARLAGLPGVIDGVRVGRTHRENWRLLDAAPGAWDAVAASKGVIINEQLARRARLSVGDGLALAPRLTLPVAGIAGDYGNPAGKAMISEELFRSLFPGIAPMRFGLRTENPAAMRDALIREAGVPEENIVDQAAVKAASMSIFERTFAVTAALNVLTLAVAAIAILMSLLTLAAMRLPQLAPVWAIGTTQRRLAGLEILRAMMLAAAVSVLAVPLGLALAWVLLAIINVEAFGWRLPMFLFPYDYAGLLALALAAALIAACWPALRLARMRPAALLRIFAHER